MIAFDHPMLAIRDPDAARAAWTRLGFNVTPFREHEMMGGGKRGGRGGNHLVMMTPQFEGSANLLELAYCDCAHASPAMIPILDRDPGMALMSVAAADATATGEQWSSEGRFFEPYTADFQWTDPETGQTDRIAFTIAVPVQWQLPLFTTPITYHDLAHYRRADWLDHPNGAQCWTRISASLPEIDFTRMSPVLTKLYGSHPISENGTQEWRCGPTAFRLLTPQSFDRLYGGLGDANTAIRIRVRDRSVARAILTSNDVVFASSSDCDLVLPGETGGFFVEFVEQ